MATIYEVDPTELIEKAAVELAKNENVNAPEWAGFVKTGRHKERAPSRNDWWYVRVAAVLRTIYLKGPIGVSKLRVKFGGKKRRGVKPARFYIGSGNIIRKVLQQLDKAGYTKHEVVGTHRGRVITPSGISFLDKLSSEIVKARPKVEKKKIEAPKAEVKKEEKPKVEAPKKKEVKKETPKEEKPKAEVKPEAPKVEEKKEEAPKKEEAKKEEAKTE